MYRLLQIAPLNGSIRVPPHIAERKALVVRYLLTVSIIVSVFLAGCGGAPSIGGTTGVPTGDVTVIFTTTPIPQE